MSSDHRPTRWLSVEQSFKKMLKRMVDGVSIGLQLFEQCDAAGPELTLSPPFIFSSVPMT